MTDLTSEQIDAMPAGPEMDALVAEYVMQWKHIDFWLGSPLAKGWDGFWDGEWVKWIIMPESDDENRVKLWSPSTDIVVAWQVVEKLVGNCDGRDFFIECWGDGEWFVASHPLGYSSRKPQANCDGKETGKPSAQLAICRFALKIMNDVG